MINMTYRNLIVFFRDKSAVFFSLLAVFIIIGLYALFLGDTMMKSMEDKIEGVRFLMDSWIMGGLLAVTAVTTTMGAFGIMVTDRDRGNQKDFYTSPLKRYQLAGGYILSAFTVGIILSLITFILSEIYILSTGGELLPLDGVIKVLVLIFLSVLSSSAMVFFMVSFFKSNNAFATASSIIGTLIGFITGIYIPIGNLPDIVQLIVKLFPVSHAGVLFRQVMMEEPLAISFAGAPEDVITPFKEELGIIFTFGDYTVTTGIHILVLLLTTVVFYLLAVWNVSRKNN